MADVVCDSDSDSEAEVMAQRRPNPPAKRRRILNPSSITAVPVYSKKVTRRQRKPPVYKHVDHTESSRRPPSLPMSKSKPVTICLSDSEEELEPDKPQSLVCLTPERPEDVRDFSDHLFQINDCYDKDEDIVIVSSEDKRKRRPANPKPRERAKEISLTFHWRLDEYKIPVLSTDPLSKAVAKLSVKLKVPPSNILLIRNDDELPVNSTITQLGLGIADIIDCLVITGEKDDESSCDVITVQLRGIEKASAQEYSLHKDAPLGSILSQYTSGLSAAAKRKVKFLFDGLKVTQRQTPSQLDMEDGDIIDVWA